jgi:alcohol dehydrogenase (cytochrome c)
VTNFVPVSQDELNNPKPADWLMLGGNMAHWNYSPLDQITRENVNQLQLVWARQLSTTGGRAGTSPLVHDGIMYLISPNDPIMTVDAATGTRIWEYVRPLPKFGEGAGLIHHRYAGAKRGVGLYGDKIFTVASDNAVVALDARTGKVVWESSRGGDGYVANTSGPIIANGILIAGGSCQNAPFGCYVTGHDITTGKELWRNEVIPHPGQPGDETWGGADFFNRWCTGVWGQIVYDPIQNWCITDRRALARRRTGREASPQERDPGRKRYSLGRAAGHRKDCVAPPTPAAGQLGPGMHVRDDARRHADASESDGGRNARGQSDYRQR